jgi:hypothetical protein
MYVYIVLRVYAGFYNDYKMVFVWTAVMLALSFWYQTYISGYNVIYWLLVADIAYSSYDRSRNPVRDSYRRSSRLKIVEDTEDTQQKLLLIIFVELFVLWLPSHLRMIPCNKQIVGVFLSINCIFCIFCVSRFKYGLFTCCQIGNSILKKRNPMCRTRYNNLTWWTHV